MRIFLKKKRQPSEQTPEDRLLIFRRSELYAQILRELCEVRPDQFDFGQQMPPAIQTHDRKEICLN